MWKTLVLYLSKKLKFLIANFDLAHSQHQPAQKNFAKFKTDILIFVTEGIFSADSYIDGHTYSDSELNTSSSFGYYKYFDKSKYLPLVGYETCIKLFILLA